MDNNKSFYKTNPRGGISLIVLVITIIVIVILATAVIVSISSNNPISEANKARFESDRDNMQSILSMTVAKIAAEKQGNVILSDGEILEGKITYSVENVVNKNNSSGSIIFGNGTNDKIDYYTGKKLPIYKAGETHWYVSKTGEVALKVGDETVGNAEVAKELTLVEAFKKGDIKVGDYLDYNAHLKNSNATVTILGSETGVGYTQTYTVNTNEVNWRVLGLSKDEKNLLLIPGEPLAKTSPDDSRDYFLHLNGPVGWYHTNDEFVGAENNVLNKIARIYASDIADVRSISIDDINNILGVKVNGKEMTGKNGNKLSGDSTIGDTYTYEEGDYSPINYLKDVDSKIYNGLVRNNVGDVVNGNAYYYEYDTAINRVENPVLYDMLFKNTGGNPENKPNYYLDPIYRSYWVVSPSSVCDFSNCAIFGPGSVDDGSVNSYGDLADSNGNVGEYGLGVCPLVSLKSDVLVKQLPKLENVTEPKRVTECYFGDQPLMGEHGKVTNKVN